MFSVTNQNFMSSMPNHSFDQMFHQPGLGCHKEGDQEGDTDGGKPSLMLRRIGEFHWSFKADDFLSSNSLLSPLPDAALF